MSNISFTTSDTPLAAWLVCNNIKLLDIYAHLRPAEFVFDNQDAARLNDLIFQWDSGSAMGNCPSFYKAYRSLVHRIKDGGR